ncbi:DMT family transporter, partial [Streptomyces sp. NPDC001919]
MPKETPAAAARTTLRSTDLPIRCAAANSAATTPKVQPASSHRSPSDRVRASAPLVRLSSPAWWGSVLLNGLGAALHVAALAYGPLSLVQPLGALTIVFALPMAALFVGRRAGSRAWRGAVLATAGLA